MRNIATRYDEPKQTVPIRRSSLPAVTFSPFDATVNTPRGEEEEEAVAGRLEIRVVDATGGATIVQTSADREPLQSTCDYFFYKSISELVNHNPFCTYNANICII